MQMWNAAADVENKQNGRSKGNDEVHNGKRRCSSYLSLASPSRNKKDTSRVNILKKKDTLGTISDAQVHCLYRK